LEISLRIVRPSGALWAHAGFLRLWTAQTVSSFGARIAREGFAMTAILSIHAAPWQLGLLAAFARGPGVVVGLFAGGIVDRTERRRVMIFSDLIRVLLILTIPVAAWFHVLSMVQLYLAAMLVGAASVLFDIADHAFLPSLIEREHLLDGNAKLGVTDSIAEIGGPALAGTLFQLFTAPLAMLGTSLTYLVSALFLFAVPANELPPEPAREHRAWYRDAADGLATILAEPLVRPILWMTVVFTLFGAFFAPLYLVYGLKTIGMSPALMGINIAIGGVGALFGASLSNTLTRSFGVGRTILAGGFLYAAFLALVPLARGPLWLSTTMMMIAQFGGDAFAPGRPAAGDARPHRGAVQRSRRRHDGRRCASRRSARQLVGDPRNAGGGRHGDRVGAAVCAVQPIDQAEGNPGHRALLKSTDREPR
jgi:MFS family permease